MLGVYHFFYKTKRLTFWVNQRFCFFEFFFFLVAGGCFWFVLFVSLFVVCFLGEIVLFCLFQFVVRFCFFLRGVGLLCIMRFSLGTCMQVLIFEIFIVFHNLHLPGILGFHFCLIVSYFYLQKIQCIIIENKWTHTRIIIKVNQIYKSYVEFIICTFQAI